jgi:hypothetical protein
VTTDLLRNYTGCLVRDHILTRSQAEHMDVAVGVMDFTHKLHDYMRRRSGDQVVQSLWLGVVCRYLDPDVYGAWVDCVEDVTAQQKAKDDLMADPDPDLGFEQHVVWSSAEGKLTTCLGPKPVSKEKVIRGRPGDCTGPEDRGRLFP